MKITRSLIATFSLCYAASLALAQPAPPPAEANETPEAKEVKKALIDFVMLLENTDIAPAKAAFGGDAEAFKPVEDFHGVFIAGKRAKAALEAKFPEEAAKRHQSADITAKGLARNIQNDAVTVTGEEASVGKMGTKLKREGGKWKVVDLISDPMGKQTMRAMLPSMTGVMNEVATEIEADKYKTMQEVEQAVRQKMQTRMRAGLVGATRPATQPAR